MSCRICHKRHHSLVHQNMVTSSNQPDNDQAHEAKNNDQGSSANPTISNVQLSSHFATSTTTALLATALIVVRDQLGHTAVLRALIDHGSQATFISERAAQTLKLKRTAIKGTVTGMGCSKTILKQAAEIQLLSRYEANFNLNIKVYIMPTRLTCQLPTRTICLKNCSHLQGLVLADPGFNQPGRIDMLLGVDVCAQIMKGEVIKGPPGTPCAQNTSLGWILFGHIQSNRENYEVSVMHLNLNLDDMLRNMWEQGTDEKRALTAEEKTCEEIYQATTHRTSEGRYIVKLPTKQKTLLSPSGRTRDIALRNLYQLEKKFEKDQSLESEYTRVMQEYIELNHLERVPENEINNPAVYLPHHAVVRQDKETSKVRTVFNASQKGNNNISLNEELLVGPQLQDDMRSLIMRWRMKRICFVADIQKMYRQILVSKEDRDLQRILWRNCKIQPVQDYRLLRVTFGTASAPYLAVRTLHQVAEDEGRDYSDAARIIKEDFYMDDLMSGKDTLQDAIKVAKEIGFILQKGGFTLQKWCSNNAEFLKQFEPSERSSQVHLDIKIDGTIRALGLQWDMGKDVFKYSLHLPSMAATVTKRTILADIQRLFDPLGWLAPSILPAKLLIQHLWIQGISWDEEVNHLIAEKWRKLRESYQYLPEVEINRWLHTSENVMNNVTVHGFCDASTQAYAAVAYLRVQL
ncbi:unnamed protein product [Parnassius mnemosyne]|uniref:Peptidase A2 domain-containing protein n=1 Tax=Parnassius mnemosyne TaxID=213953 RepID=A0AAV1M4C5_9NEOP